MKANEAYSTVAQHTALETRRNEAYGKLDSSRQSRTNQFDTRIITLEWKRMKLTTHVQYENVDTRRNEAYGVLDSTQQHEVGYATIISYRTV